MNGRSGYPNDVHAGSLFASSITEPSNLNHAMDPREYLTGSLEKNRVKPRVTEPYVHLTSTYDPVKESQTATTGGRKFDGGKLQYGLLPPGALKAIVEILTFGAEKYEPNNWKYVPDSKRRYFDAAQRHLWAWQEGEKNDPESGKNHLAHALCCLMFLYEHDTFKLR